MIQKHATRLLGLVCLFSVSACAQPTNPVVNSGVGTNSSPVVSSNAVVNAGVVPKPGKEDIRHLGDPAPPLTVMAWAKGKPVHIQPGTNFYVLVFCSLGQANDFALTNLSNLQKRYRDNGLVVAAISDDDPRQLKLFTDMKADEIDFSVAADDLASRTARTYQNAFQQYQLPRAYIVSRDARVLWYGHPLRDNLGQVVDDIVNGRYDLEQTKKDIVATEQMQEYLGLAREGDTNTCIKAGRMLLAIRGHDAAQLCDLASHIALDPYLMYRDVVVANAALDRALELGATNTTDIAVDRAILLFQTGHLEEGLARAKQAMPAARGQDEIGEVQTCIHAMEVRIAAAKASQTNTPPAQP